MWGIRAFCRFSPEGCGALVGYSFLSKMAAIVPTRTSGYISAHGSEHKCSQVFIVIQINTSITLGHGLKKANDCDVDDLLFRRSVKTTFLNVDDITYGML